jgi:hypothetical protein
MARTEELDLAMDAAFVSLCRELRALGALSVRSGDLSATFAAVTPEQAVRPAPRPPRKETASERLDRERTEMSAELERA